MHISLQLKIGLNFQTWLDYESNLFGHNVIYLMSGSWKHHIAHRSTEDTFQSRIVIEKYPQNSTCRKINTLRLDWFYARALGNTNAPKEKLLSCELNSRLNFLCSLSCGLCVCGGMGVCVGCVWGGVLGVCVCLFVCWGVFLIVCFCLFVFSLNLSGIFKCTQLLWLDIHH